jgi:hypothetical protein
MRVTIYSTARILSVDDNGGAKIVIMRDIPGPDRSSVQPKWEMSSS